MNMKKILISILFSLLNYLAIAQDPSFSLFYNNPIYYNPAMNAINKGLTFRANARNQWSKIPGKFNTFSFSFDGEIVGGLSMGMNLVSDVAGEGLFRTSGGKISLSQCFQREKHILQFGMSTAYMNKSIDWTRLTFSDQYDEVLGKIYTSGFIPPDNNSYNYVDLGAGVAYQYFYDRKTTGFFKKMMVNVGASMNHLNRPKDAYFSGNDYIPFKTVIHTRNQLLLGRNVYSFSGIYERQKEFETRTIGFDFLTMQKVTFGLWNRSGRTINGQRFESFISTFGCIIPFKNIYFVRLNLSLDFTITKLRTASFGSSEASIVYILDDAYMLKKLHEKRKKKNMFKCPADFKGFR